MNGRVFQGQSRETTAFSCYSYCCCFSNLNQWTTNLVSSSAKHINLSRLCAASWMNMVRNHSSPCPQRSPSYITRCVVRPRCFLLQRQRGRHACARARTDIPTVCNWLGCAAHWSKTDTLHIVYAYVFVCVRLWIKKCYPISRGYSHTRLNLCSFRVCACECAHTSGTRIAPAGPFRAAMLMCATNARCKRDLYRACYRGGWAGERASEGLHAQAPSHHPAQSVTMCVWIVVRYERTYAPWFISAGPFHCVCVFVGGGCTCFVVGDFCETHPTK